MVPVEELGGVQASGLLRSTSVPAKSAASEQAAQAEKRVDRTEFSDQGRALAALNDTSAIRKPLVAALKAAVTLGRYRHDEALDSALDLILKGVGRT